MVICFPLVVENGKNKQTFPQPHKGAYQLAPATSHHTREPVHMEYNENHAPWSFMADSGWPTIKKKLIDTDSRRWLPEGKGWGKTKKIEYMTEGD